MLLDNSHSEQSDASLIYSAQTGNHHAFDVLVMRYKFKLIKILGYYISENDIADVCQDVFIKVYKSLHAFRGESSFYTWLYRVAINTAKNHILSESKQHVILDFELSNIEPIIAKYQLNEYSTPEKTLMSDELEALIYKAIDDLPEELRNVIILREIEELSYGKIADLLNCPIGTIRSRIFRARSSIEEKLKPHKLH